MSPRTSHVAIFYDDSWGNIVIRDILVFHRAMFLGVDFLLEEIQGRGREICILHRKKENMTPFKKSI